MVVIVAFLVILLSVCTIEIKVLAFRPSVVALIIIIFLPFSILVRMISFCFFLLLNLLHARIHDVATLRRFHVRYPTRLLAPPCKHVPWWTRRSLL